MDTKTPNRKHITLTNGYHQLRILKPSTLKYYHCPLKCFTFKVFAHLLVWKGRFRNAFCARRKMRFVSYHRASSDFPFLWNGSYIITQKITFDFEKSCLFRIFLPRCSHVFSVWDVHSFT
ncbi:hypothetical protein CEXT_183211 [Caerostris extrusa]|uniref:Uncharacterized protein n=1 Tax=Caerostris extrusa TaxID=172846 RepID=A0AAV4Y6T9_CAEEX|nr:hypothetical protein CEXT_183211 [Caerostris extrusa]